MRLAHLAVICAPLAACGKDATGTGTPAASDSAGPDSGAGPTTTEPAAPEAGVVWGPGSLTLTVSGGGGAWWFGMAETTQCTDCWTGEDCLYGYETGDGAVYVYCHDIEDSGATLTYGGNLAELVPGTTVFQNNSLDGRITYLLESDPEYGGDGSCWVWGQDPSYYDGMLCGQL